jgi:four helix bundle protein
MQDFKKLDVWALAHQLALDTYRCTASFPSFETYGLVAQIRRATTSVPANIAEGSGRRSSKEFARYLDIARASAVEVEYHLLLAHDLGYLDGEALGALSSQGDRVRRMLTSLIERVRLSNG